MTPLINIAGFSGVTAIVALPNNQLLVLERVTSASNPPFRIRIYLADISGATYVSALAGLICKTFTPASIIPSKTSLVEVAGPNVATIFVFLM